MPLAVYMSGNEQETPTCAIRRVVYVAVTIIVYTITDVFMTRKLIIARCITYGTGLG